MFIPAKLTWLIQPCDAHCIALYERYLKLVILRYKARHHHQTVPTVLAWFTIIADKIIHMMNKRPWVISFRGNGFSDFQMGDIGLRQASFVWRCVFADLYFDSFV